MRNLLLPFVSLLIGMEKGYCQDENNNTIICYKCEGGIPCQHTDISLAGGNPDRRLGVTKCTSKSPEPPTCYAFYDQKEKAVIFRGCYNHTANFIEIAENKHRVKRCTLDPRTNQYGWVLCTCHSDSYCNSWLKKDMVVRAGDSGEGDAHVERPMGVIYYMMEILVLGMAWKFHPVLIS